MVLYIDLEAVPRAYRTSSLADSPTPFPKVETDVQLACHRHLADSSFAVRHYPSETLLKEEPRRCNLKNQRNQDDQILRLGEERNLNDNWQRKRMKRERVNC